MTIPKASSVAKVEVIRTDTFLDRLSGIGGIPKGKITEVWGDSGVGKSSVCLQAVAGAQRGKQRVLWADVEWYYDPVYAAKMGVNNDQLDLLRDPSAEEILNVIEKEVSAGNYDLVFLDSVGALRSDREAEKEAGQKTIGVQAGLLSPFLRRIVSKLVLKNTALVVINHSFTDIMSGAIKTSGGKKLEYHRSLSIRLKQRTGANVIKQGDKRVGTVVVGQVKRNKLAGNEGMEVEASFMFDVGFVSGLDVVQEAIDRGVLERQGNTYWMDGEKLGMIGKIREMAKEEEFVQRLKTRLV
jgi:recombination protein RecA